MKLLVIGSGGREHAIVWKMAQSKRVKKIFCAPGNPGIGELAECVNIRADDINGLKAFAVKKGIDLTVVGPELPLTLGIVDGFEEAGLKIFGPSRMAAEIEGSKVFAKNLMQRYGIPTATYHVFDNPDDARVYVEAYPPPMVIKADGLAGGKGVIVCKTREETLSAIELIMREKAFGKAGDRVVIEEFLKGQEASFLALTDGKTVLPLAPAQDHKAVYDGDKGPNTGGMGAYSPAPSITPRLQDRVMKEIMIPTVEAMKAEGRPYKGVLYAGLMITKDGPKVLEFNCRFGDPEAQPILMRMKGNLLGVLMATISGRLSRVNLEWDRRSAVCVVMASRGYPGGYRMGDEIKGLDKVSRMPVPAPMLRGKQGKDVVIFHAGTAIKGGRLVTSGGRVLGVTAVGMGIRKAIERVYKAISVISWKGVHYRKDIGAKALRR
ncbi:MAG: phosphoribosylamine--glycine ligase [Deltaproteobacteria bacterium]|nr:phosphoribosylamine--glycine ligase [Deltaproteobacteria bacterium]